VDCGRMSRTPAGEGTWLEGVSKQKPVDNKPTGHGKLCLEDQTGGNANVDILNGTTSKKMGGVDRGAHDRGGKGGRSRVSTKQKSHCDPSNLVKKFVTRQKWNKPIWSAREPGGTTRWGAKRKTTIKKEEARIV